MKRESFVFFSLLDPIYGVYNVLLRVTKVMETQDKALSKSHYPIVIPRTMILKKYVPQLPFGPQKPANILKYTVQYRDCTIFMYSL